MQFQHLYSCTLSRLLYVTIFRMFIKRIRYRLKREWKSTWTKVICSFITSSCPNEEIMVAFSRFSHCVHNMIALSTLYKHTLYCTSGVDSLECDLLTPYTLRLVFIFSKLFSLHLPWYWLGEFDWRSGASEIGDHFQYSHCPNIWFKGDAVRRNMLTECACLVGLFLCTVHVVPNTEESSQCVFLRWTK